MKISKILGIAVGVFLGNLSFILTLWLIYAILSRLMGLD